MSLLAATQITAVATAGLALFAAVTAVFAFLAFRKQSAEVRLLQQQAERDIEQRRRHQAAHVFAWVGRRPLHNPADIRPAACLRNTSRQPIYSVSLGWGATGQQTWPVLLPDSEHAIPGAGSAVADGTAAIWAEFRDAAGVRWRTTSLGELNELPRGTLCGLIAACRLDREWPLRHAGAPPARVGSRTVAVR